MNLSKAIEVVRHNNAAAAAQTDITPAAGIDMQNVEGVLFAVPFGTITAGAVTKLLVQQSDDDGVADAYGTLAGGEITVADTESNKVRLVDVYRPRKRYVKLVVDRGTQDAVVDGIIAMKYGQRKLPTTQGATVGGSTLLLSPAEA